MAVSLAGADLGCAGSWCWARWRLAAAGRFGLAGGCRGVGACVRAYVARR